MYPFLRTVLLLSATLAGCSNIPTDVSTPAVSPNEAWEGLWARYTTTPHDSVSLDGMDAKFLEFETTYPTNTRAAEAVWWAGYSLYLQRRWSQAQQVFETLRTRYPSSVYSDNAAHYVGRCLVERGDFENARDTIKSFLSNRQFLSSTYRADSWYYLGRSWMGSGNGDSARFAFSVVLDSFSFDTSRAAAATYETGRAFYGDSSWTQAQIWFAKVIDSFPAVIYRQDNAIYWFSRCQHRRNHEDSAIGGYRRLLLLFPTSSFADQAAYQIGAAFYDRTFRLGPSTGYDSAIASETEFLNSYAISQYRDDAVYEQAKSHFRLGNSTIAVNLFDAVIAWNPVSNLQDYALYYKSRILAATGDCPGAREAIAKLTSDHPTSPALPLAINPSNLNGCVIP